MIRTIEPPATAISAAENKLAELIHSRAHTVLNNLPEGDRNNTHVTLPHHVYDLGLDTLLRRANLPTNPTALHMLVGHGQTLSSALHFDPESHQVRSFQAAPHIVDGIQKAVAAASELPVTKEKDFELRVLRIPALNVVAVWLKDEKGEEDRLLPVGPTDPALEVHRAYTVNEFLSIAQERARFLYGDAPNADEMGG